MSTTQQGQIIFEQTCMRAGVLLSTSYESMASQIIFIILFGKLLHTALRRLYIPRLLSDIFHAKFVQEGKKTQVAIVIAKVQYIRDIFQVRLGLFFGRFGNSMFSIYFFALGLEMDPFAVFDPPGKDGYIAYAGMISTLAITAICQKALVNNKVGLFAENSVRANLGLGTALAATGSPLLTRLITELKLSKTAAGQAAVRAGIFSDMIATSLMCIGNLIFHDDSMLSDSEQWKHPFYVAGIVAEIITLMVVSQWVLNKINEHNPEGRPIKGIYITGLVVAVLFVCFLDERLHMDVNLAGFMVGLALPREGRVSRVLINNLNFFLNSVILPLYLVNVCLSIRHSELHMNPKVNLVINMPLLWPKLLISIAIGTVGKILGTVMTARFYGMKWLDSVALGQLLSIKGYYHIFCAYEAWNHLIINDTTFLALLCMIVITSAITPLVGYGIAAWARRKARSQLMGLQFHKSGTELRIMMGLQGPQNLPIALTLVEAIRWTKESGNLTLYAIDMIELTERAAATLVKGEGSEAVEVTDEEVMDMRNQIGEALEAFQQESNDGIKVRRLLAISSFEYMDRDICICAEDVLQHAPCTVGIMVDRGFGHINQGSLSLVGKNIVVVFIGGWDDREALTVASHMSQHPAIKLTVVRFLPDVVARARDNVRSKMSLNLNQSFTSHEELQMQADDEFFAEFYKQHIANKEVGYVEKHVADGAELVMELRALESQYELFVVGKGRDRKSILTDGLDDWAECPELGPVGDVVASSEFSTTASALIIQQYDARKHYNVIDEEFMPF
ncbi:hypothetical protein FCM35_KLT11972 [Carex littledalei]|uniref:Cation/H+ exchanger domain-containing protein n=1 Tax=Carex littledalei TaxID=544730 RepID=A0A833QPD8_9POAL|nr:hypothetical protein FCM35_KLT11972 [Carex littledalei]